MILLLLTVVLLHLVGYHLLLNHGLLGRRGVGMLPVGILLHFLLLLLLGLRAYYEVGAILLALLLRQLLLVRALVCHLLIEASLILIAGDVIDELLRILTRDRQGVELPIVKLEIVEVVDVYADCSDRVDVTHEVAGVAVACVGGSHALANVLGVEVQAKHLLPGGSHVELVRQELLVALRLDPIEVVIIEVVEGEVHQLRVAVLVRCRDLLQAVVEQVLSNEDVRSAVVGRLLGIRARDEVRSIRPILLHLVQACKQVQLLLLRITYVLYGLDLVSMVLLNIRATA